MFQEERINFDPRFAGFPCQTLSEGGNAHRSIPEAGHIQGAERMKGLAEPICNASGGITHPCRSDPHRAAINGPLYPHRRWRPGTAKAGLERNQRGRRLTLDTGGPINGSVNVVPVPGSLFDGGKERVGRVWLKTGESMETDSMGRDAREVVNVASRIIAEGESAGAREVEAAFFQTHINADSTEVRIRVRF